MSKIHKIKNPHKPWTDLPFPCWGWVEGNNDGGNIWSYWEKFPSAGHMITAISGDDGSVIEYWSEDSLLMPPVCP